jgi:hypothetical protein
MYVSIVSCGCCKSRSGCCNGCKRMLQAFIPNVSSVFYVRMLQVFQTHVSSVSSVFFCMLQVLYLDVSELDRDVAHVAMVFQLYVVKVSSECCKIRLVCCTVWPVAVAAVGAESWVNPRGFPCAERGVSTCLVKNRTKTYK